MAVFATVPKVLAEVRYTIIDLPGTRAYGINNSGQIVGGYNAQGHAFLWEDGTSISLEGLGMPYGINNSGQVVGLNGLWDSGVVTDIGGRGFSINDSGQVAGGYNAQDHAFLWEGGVHTDLGTLGGDFSEARGINASGQIVGRSYVSSGQTRAFIWENETMTEPGVGTAPNDSLAFGINNSGQIIGYAYDVGGANVACIWDDDGVTYLGTLGGGSDSYGRAINNLGQAVGWSYYPGYINRYPFLWENDTLLNLQELVPSDSGWWLQDAYDINDNGWIVGYGLDPTGAESAFLLVPEPATLSLLALGGLALLRRRK